jgi:multidrug efflux system membrane fusion protein
MMAATNPAAGPLGFGLRLGTGGFLLTLCVAAGCNPPPARTPEAPKVTVAHPENRKLTDYAEFNGKLEANETVEVRSRVRGYIAKVNFEDGQVVKAGDLLFVLDPRDFDIEIGRAQDKVDVVKSQQLVAEKESARQQFLLRTNSTSVAEAEKAVADAKSLAAQVSAAQNEVERAKSQKDYSEIKAHIGGRISAAQLVAGNLVNAGGSDPLLATIVAIDPIRIVFNIDERSLYRFAKSQGVQGKGLDDLLAKLKDVKTPFEFGLDSEKGFPHKEATLAFANNRIDPDTGTLQLYGLISNKDGAFLPGSRVRVRLTVGKPYDGLLVPETCIQADQDKRYVLVAVEKDGKTIAERRNVTPGALIDDPQGALRAIEPADQLAEGEKLADWWVIIDNIQRVRINYPVEPQKPAETQKPAH